MFLYMLSDNQKIAFLDLAGQAIRVDGRIASEEMALLETMKREMALPSTVLPQGRGLSEAANAFDTRASKVAALLELIGLGLADGHLHDMEDDFLAKVASVFGISLHDFETMKQWVARQVALVSEANLMMQEG